MIEETKNGYTHYTQANAATDQSRHTNMEHFSLNLLTGRISFYIWMQQVKHLCCGSMQASKRKKWIWKKSEQL